MTQLWLFSLRHSVKPHADTTCHRRMASWSTETHSLNSMATLAWKLGFSSAEIKALRKEDIDSTDTDHMLRVFCVDGFYHIDEGKLRSMTHRLKECWRNLKRIKETQRGVPRFVTDDARTMTRRRYNCPLEDEHQQDRSYLFLENVFSADQSCALYLTSFVVTREIIFAFFGKSSLYDVFALPSSTSSEERLHQCETHTDIMQTEQQEDEAVNERSPVELLPHPPGTPNRDRMRSHSLLPDNSLNLPDEPSGPPSHTPVDIDFSLSNTFTDYMDGVEQDVPLAAGFEDHISKAPLEKKAVVSLHRKVTDILRLWYESENTTLVVLFLFESRAYYKFLIQSELGLRSTLRDLGRDHYFLIIDDYGIKAPDMKDINEAALREHLVLVGRKCGPGQGFEEQDGQISVDNLRDYVIKFDVRTGKRKAAESPSMSAKRRAPM
ncbi:hypothetical protein AnigIFM63326_000819 [Aspergillus niger]|nr:hypothetical protein AnigIFM63326_000819 [Aspergillus niger]